MGVTQSGWALILLYGVKYDMQSTDTGSQHVHMRYSTYVFTQRNLQIACSPGLNRSGWFYVAGCGNFFFIWFRLTTFVICKKIWEILKQNQHISVFYLGFFKCMCVSMCLHSQDKILRPSPVWFLWPVSWPLSRDQLHEITVWQSTSLQCSDLYEWLIADHLVLWCQHSLYEPVCCVLTELLNAFVYGPLFKIVSVRPLPSLKPLSVHQHLRWKEASFHLDVHAINLGAKEAS